MEEDLLSVEEVAQIVDQEGIGYAILDYLGADRISDKRLAESWKKAKEILSDIEIFLQSNR